MIKTKKADRHAKVLARLAETADYTQSVNFVKQAALRVFGDLTIDPPGSVRITGGVPHIHVVLPASPELRQVVYFTKLIRSAKHLSNPVVSVSPDKDHSPFAYKVEFKRD